MVRTIKSNCNFHESEKWHKTNGRKHAYILGDSVEEKKNIHFECVDVIATQKHINVRLLGTLFDASRVYTK